MKIRNCEKFTPWASSGIFAPPMAQWKHLGPNSPKTKKLAVTKSIFRTNWPWCWKSHTPQGGSSHHTNCMCALTHTWFTVPIVSKSLPLGTYFTYFDSSTRTLLSPKPPGCRNDPPPAGHFPFYSTRWGIPQLHVSAAPARPNGTIVGHSLALGG